MTERTARERLLEEARSAPREARTLKGGGGHTASLEPSTAGPSRMVRVLHEGREVSWFFAMEEGEVRPSFYPSDVPYLPDLSCTLLWDDETGLNVRWSVAGNRDRIRELREQVRPLNPSSVPDRVAEVSGMLEDATREERLRVFQSLKDDVRDSIATWAGRLFGDSKPDRLPPSVSEAVDRIVGFHRNAGWKVREEAVEKGASRRVVFARGPSERRLHAISVLGITTIGLVEQPTGQYKAV